MPSRKLIALLLCLLTGPALAGYMTLLGAGAGGVAPAAQGNFIQSAYSDNLSSLNAIATPTFSGLATQFDSTGTLTYRPNNLVLYSNDQSNAAWTSFSPSGSATASIVTFTGAGNDFRYQTLTIPSTGRYIASVVVSSGTKTGTIVFRDGILGSVVISLTATPTRYSYYTNIAAGTYTLGLSNRVADGGDGIAGTVVVSGYTLSAVTYETTPRPQDQVITTAAAYYGPRFDYTYNGSSWVPAGLLVEGAATNLTIQSADLSNAVWLIFSGARSTDGTLQLNGSAALKMTATAATSYHMLESVSANVTASATTAYAVSVDVKGGTSTKAWISFGGNNHSAGAVFDISGTADTTATELKSTGYTANSGVARYRGNGWFRLTLALTTDAVAGDGFTAFGITTALTGNTWTSFSEVTSTTVGTETMYFANPQVEAGSSATSYTPTGASAVTRPTETVQLTGAALAALQGANGSAIIQTVSEGTTAPAAITNLIRGTNSILYRDTTNKAGTTNGTNILLSTSTPTWSSATRTGLAWSASGRSLNYTGGTIATDANIVTNSGTVYLGSNAGSAAENGWYQSMAFYNVRLPDATLTTKLTVNSSYAANDNGIRYAFANDNLPVAWRLAL